MKMNLQVGCVVFRVRNGAHEFLLLKRIADKGGFWQFPGGRVEDKDLSILHAALRELKEEANIGEDALVKIMQDVHLFEFDKHYLTGKPIPKITEHVYAFEISPDFEISIDCNIDEEHEEFKWVSFDDALRLLKWDNNKDALKELIGILETGNFPGT